jgi:hypothetical protein
MVLAVLCVVVAGGSLAAQIYRPVQGIGLPEAERRGSTVTLPGVEDLISPDVMPRAAAPTKPADLDTGIWQSISSSWNSASRWVTRMAKALWASLTWWLDE